MKNLKKVISLFLIMLLVVTLFPTNFDSVQAASKVKLNKTKITVDKGNTYTLSIKNTTKTVKWTSSNKKIATVNSNGLVTGKKVGTATITAKVSGKKYTCKVTVKQSDADFFNYESIILAKGNSFTQYFVYNHVFTYSGVKWSSSNKNIATINNKGTITAKSAGEVTITAKYKNKSYNFKVYIIDEKILYENEYVKVKLKSIYNQLADNYWHSLASENINLEIQNKTDKVLTFVTENVGINGNIVFDGYESTTVSANSTSSYHHISLDSIVKLNSINTISGYMHTFGSDYYTISTIDFSNIIIK